MGARVDDVGLRQEGLEADKRRLASGVLDVGLAVARHAPWVRAGGQLHAVHPARSRDPDAGDLPADRRHARDRGDVRDGPRRVEHVVGAQDHRYEMVATDARVVGARVRARPASRPDDRNGLAAPGDVLDVPGHSGDPAVLAGAPRAYRGPAAATGNTAGSARVGRRRPRRRTSCGRARRACDTPRRPRRHSHPSQPGNT